MHAAINASLFLPKNKKNSRLYVSSPIRISFFFSFCDVCGARARVSVFVSLKSVLTLAALTFLFAQPKKYRVSLFPFHISTFFFRCRSYLCVTHLYCCVHLPTFVVVNFIIIAPTESEWDMFAHLLLIRFFSLYLLFSVRSFHFRLPLSFCHMLESMCLCHIFNNDNLFMTTHRDTTESVEGYRFGAERALAMSVWVQTTKRKAEIH